MIRRFIISPNTSFFLLGPRGTGKSTWLKQSFPDALWLDLLEPDLERQFIARPERLRDFLEANPHKQVIVLDEIQRVPQLLTLVHAIIEEKRSVQFILTGSSARKLKQKGVDLLAGRALLKHMHPFIAAELGTLFDLEKALTQGLLPLVWDAEQPNQVLKSYCALYLKEEVQAEALVRNVGSFARFLEVVSFSHGSVITTSNIARECDVARTTVDTYMQILKDLMLGYTLPVFTRRAKRAVSNHPKFYLFDAGVYTSLRPRGPLDRVEEIHGVALEGLVAQHLRAWIDLQSSPHELSFWRTRTGLEVDFIVYGQHNFIAIEVKNNDRLSPRDTHGLEAFREEYPESQQVLVYRGKQRVMQKGVLCIPCQEFLLSLRPETPIAP